MSERRSALDSVYLIRPCPGDPDAVLVTEPSSDREQRIHREDADPEHRWLKHRLAAAWFGNLPQSYADH